MFRSIYLIFILLLASIPAIASDSHSRQKIYTIAFAQDTLANDWRLAQVKQLQKAFEKYPDIRFIYTDAEGDTTKQIHDIKMLMHQNIDLLITSPRNATIMTPIISEIYKKIPVVLITRRVNSNDFTAVVSPDDYQIAVEAAHTMAKALKEKGKVLMLRGIPTSSTAMNREKGFIDTLNKHYPDITISSIKDGNYLRTDAIMAVEHAITSGIEFDAIYAHSDSMATGARIAMQHANIDVKSKIIIGIDYISEARKAIMDGEQYASFVYPTCAEQTADVVMKILKQQDFNKEVSVQSKLITKENVDKISPIF